MVMDPAAAGSIVRAVGVPMAMEEAAAAGADKMPAGAAAARAPAGALVTPVAAAAAAAAPAPPAWTRPSARLVWVLAAALFLLGCAEAGLALLAMILPAGKACAPNAEVRSMHTAAGSLVMGVSVQVLAAIMAVAGPAWEVVVFGTVMGTLTACLFPAHGVLWLLVDCDSVFIAFHFWFLYVVLWPVAAIGAVVALKCEVEDRRPSPHPLVVTS